MKSVHVDFQAVKVQYLVTPYYNPVEVVGLDLENIENRHRLPTYANSLKPTKGSRSPCQTFSNIFFSNSYAYSLAIETKPPNRS